MTGFAHAVGSWTVNQLYHAGFIVSLLANAQYHTSAILLAENLAVVTFGRGSVRVCVLPMPMVMVQVK